MPFKQKYFLNHEEAKMEALSQLFNTSTYRNFDQPYGFLICLPEDVQINKVRRIVMFLRFKLDY